GLIVWLGRLAGGLGGLGVARLVSVVVFLSFGVRLLVGCFVLLFVGLGGGGVFGFYGVGFGGGLGGRGMFFKVLMGGLAAET
ncbi:hypothetical protein AAHH79_37380, partial [Burkholderia pseudomallei]